MKIRLIYPAWPKLDRQVTFHLPPHGPVVFAASVPEEVEISFFDDNVETVPFDDNTDLVAISTMLTAQLPRAFEIADKFRALGKKVIFGGISTMLHSEEVSQHADCVFLGETEGRFEAVINDFKQGRLKPVYDFMDSPPSLENTGPANRKILKRELYRYRGVQMVDLVHASRGCKFNCFPCCNRFLGGKTFRPRPVGKVIEEIENIPNNRLFLVDNSLAQDKEWVMELFRNMIPLKRKWVSHPIIYEKDVLKLAAKAGCWYVYQAIFDTSDVIRERVKMLHDYGIGVEGTIILGTDDQDEDYIKRLVDFLCEINLDIAEFTILTPFPHTPIRTEMLKQGRIIHNNWIDYTADRVVFKPAKMTVQKLEKMNAYAWDTYYKDSGYQLRMGQLLRQVTERERLDGTIRRFNPRSKDRFSRKQVRPE